MITSQKTIERVGMAADYVQSVEALINRQATMPAALVAAVAVITVLWDLSDVVINHSLGLNADRSRK